MTDEIDPLQSLEEDMRDTPAPEPPRRSWWRRALSWVADHAPEIAAAILARKGGQP
jgi:hypothetical protein